MIGRNLDFKHRFNTSRWAEDLLFTTISQRKSLIVKRYGQSKIASAEALRALKLDKIKEPDLLIFDRSKLSVREQHLLGERNLQRLDRRLLEPRHEFSFVHKKALVGIEVEFSPYKARKMSGRHWKPKTQQQWDRHPLKHAKPPTAPNVWVKEEDLRRLQHWETKTGVPIVVAQVFNQEAFAVPLETISKFARRLKHRNAAASRNLQLTGGIFYKDQNYNRVDAEGAGERKAVFLVTPAIAIQIGSIKGVKVSAQLGTSTSQKYVTHVLFRGGRLRLTDAFVRLVHSLR